MARGGGMIWIGRRDSLIRVVVVTSSIISLKYYVAHVTVTEVWRKARQTVKINPNRTSLPLLVSIVSSALRYYHPNFSMQTPTSRPLPCNAEHVFRTALPIPSGPEQTTPTLPRPLQNPSSLSVIHSSIMAAIFGLPFSSVGAGTTTTTPRDRNSAIFSLASHDKWVAFCTTHTNNIRFGT